MFSAERLHRFDTVEAKGALLVSQLAVGDEKVTIAQQRLDNAFGFEAVLVAIADPEGQGFFNSCLLYTSDAADE